MGVVLTSVPCTLLKYSGKKEKGEAHTVKELEIEVQLGADNAIVEALSSGPRPLFKGLDLLEQGAADGGGPYDMVLCRKIGALALELFVAVGGTGTGKAKPGKKVLGVDNAKLQGKWKIHLAANMETMTSRLKFKGGVAREVLATIDDHTGCDLFLSLRTLQTEAEELASMQGGSKPREKGAKKVQLDIEGDDDVDATDDEDEDGEGGGDLGVVAGDDDIGSPE